MTKNPLCLQKAQGTIIDRGSTLIHTENTPYLIGSLTGASGAYWAHSEAVSISPCHTASHLPAALWNDAADDTFLVTDLPVLFIS